MSINKLQELIEKKASEQLKKDIQEFHKMCVEKDFFIGMNGYRITVQENDAKGEKIGDEKTGYTFFKTDAAERIYPNDDGFHFYSFMYKNALPKRITQATKDFMEKFERSQEVLGE